MKIQKITLVNFMGINGSLELELPQIAALIGKNGMGKTTIMNAIRYALTGAEPEGDIINLSASGCQVNITLSDISDGTEYTFTRIKDREKPSKFKINGKATTQKSMNEKIEDVIGIPLDKIKILSSSEVVAAMQPREFCSFILDYIPEKLKLDDIFKLIPESTMGMNLIMEANLPEEDIDLSVLDNFADMCKYNRKELKSSLANKQTLYESKPKEKLSVDKKEIEKRLSDLNNIESVYKIYLAKKEAYDNAIVSLKRHNDTIEKLKSEVAAITVSRPDPAAYESMKKQETACLETLNNQKVAISGASSALKQLELTLSALEKPICPISPLINCHQDKTVAKEEVSESITATKEGINAMQAEVEKAERKLTEIRDDLNKLQTQSVLYEKKIQLAKQIKLMEDNRPEVPAEPEEVIMPDVATEKFQLNTQLKNIAEYEEGLKLCSDIEAIKTELDDYERLVKATAEKGPVRTGIISSYLKIFEDLCNERSMKVRPEIRFEFISQDGVVVLMDNGKGAKLPYASLSGGEKAYMIFIIMDMLNALCGSNLLLLDELSVVDEKCFDALLDIVTTYAKEYDHILLAAVDHEDTLRSVKSHDIPMLTLDCTVKEK